MGTDLELLAEKVEKHQVKPPHSTRRAKKK
jgi:hypothetical protein